MFETLIVIALFFRQGVRIRTVYVTVIIPEGLIQLNMSILETLCIYTITQYLVFLGFHYLICMLMVKP